MAGEQAKEDKAKETEARTREQELDDALAGSFPASDPPAPVVKGTTANPGAQEKKRKD
jgi:hypothetical protein